MEKIIYCVLPGSLTIGVYFLAFGWLYACDFESPIITKKLMARLTLFAPLWLPFTALWVVLVALIGLFFLIKKVIRLAFPGKPKKRRVKPKKEWN